MVKHTLETYEIKPPHALRPREPITLEQGARHVASMAGKAAASMPKRVTPPLRPLVLGATAALMVGFVLDIGPWSAITGRLLGTAGAQEAPRAQTAGDFSVPSEADRAALRYFASQGEVQRLEAELRRLRALYPGWTPPRDLLDPESEDTELQELWQLVGNQRYAEAEQQIAERRQRDPGWNPPQRLLNIIEISKVRQRLVAASDARRFADVLSIAAANEQLLTCNDVDAIWRVAEAFAESGRPKRAFDAYAYIIQNCENADDRASSLQKAATQLDAQYVTDLFALGDTDANGRSEFESAQLGIVRAAIARGGEQEGALIPNEWLQFIATEARTGQDLQDAMLIGFYLYRQGNPKEAAEWFRFALDNGLGSDAAEGYIVALRATGDREDEFLAREVAYQWRDQSPELMEAYLDAVASLLTADQLGPLSVEDVEQTVVNRFVPVVIGQRDANGAQALGWYAFNTCQFIIAEEWFITSANWVPSEPAIFGLALSRLRLGDQEGFDEVVQEWGPLYQSVAGLSLGGSTDPTTQIVKAEDDPTSELGISSVVCDPEERERLRRLIVDQPGSRGLSTTEAGSMTSVRVKALAARPKGMVRPAIPRRSVVIQPQPVEDNRSVLAPAQRRLARPSGTIHAGNGATVRQAQAVGRPIQRRSTVVTGANRVADTPRSTVRRRVRQGQLDRTEDARVRSIVSRPRRTVSGTSSTSGGTAAQRALTSRNFGACVSITDRGIRNGTLSAEDATARGFCLLELRRPVEAAQAFQLAKLRSRFGSNANQDAVYGQTLAAIAANLTDEAAIAASSGPLSRPRRTEVQIGILTQRAIAANRDGRYVEALYYLDQRDRIAPLQKDLMLLRGFAYQNAGDFESADKIFRAVNQAGTTPESLRARAVTIERQLPAATRPTNSGGFN